MEGGWCSLVENSDLPAWGDALKTCLLAPARQQSACQLPCDPPTTSAGR